MMSKLVVLRICWLAATTTTTRALPMKPTTTIRPKMMGTFFFAKIVLKLTNLINLMCKVDTLKTRYLPQWRRFVQEQIHGCNRAWIHPRQRSCFRYTTVSWRIGKSCCTKRTSRHCRIACCPASALSCCLEAWLARLLPSSIIALLSSLPSSPSASQRSRLEILQPT